MIISTKILIKTKTNKKLKDYRTINYLYFILYIIIYKTRLINLKIIITMETALSFILFN